MQNNWRREWRKAPKEGRYGISNRIAPSLRPTKHFKELENSRELFGRLLQCRTGHGYTGEYRKQFVPGESVDCPCGEPFQTREHLIRECPLYEDQRDILREISRDISLPEILGTPKGIHRGPHGILEGIWCILKNRRDCPRTLTANLRGGRGTGEELVGGLGDRADR